MIRAHLWIILTIAALLASCGSGSNLSNRDVDELLNVVKLSDCEIIHDNGSISFKRSETCDKARLTGAQGFYRFGQSDFHKGKYEEAILNYSKAIYLEPNVADDIYLKRGSIYHILGRYEEAISDYLAYIEIKPEDVRTYQFLALSYIELGRNEEAIAAYDKAAALIRLIISTKLFFMMKVASMKRRLPLMTQRLQSIMSSQKPITVVGIAKETSNVMKRLSLIMIGRLR